MTAVGERSTRSIDTVGAALMVVGLLGTMAWLWQLMRDQLTTDASDSFADRIDLIARALPLLVLAGTVTGIGVGLRSVAARPSSSQSTFARPFGPILMSAAVALGMLVGAAELATKTDEPTTLLSELRDNPLAITEFQRAAIATASPNTLPLDTYTLEIANDGCGVLRSGDIGERLTWVVKDQDGFRVLGRNAAGETRYRYYEPGSYSVVLEAWGGGHYVEVSNEVAIAC